jgi:pyruvate dehydrogenase E2 component (dihydrolipoamide acetyltransferase)
MAETITLPKLGFDMHEGTFLNWTKNVGDTIQIDDVIAEIESDKATIEVPSTASGVLLQTLVESGQVVAVGAPIAVIGAPGEKPAAVAATVVSAAPAAPAGASSAQAGGNGAAQPASAAIAQIGEAPSGEIKASPLARKIAFDRGIDLRQVRGTGPGGRITKSDVESFKPGVAPVPVSAPAAPARAPSPAPAARPQPAAPAAPAGSGVTEQPISKIRQRVGARMTESKQTVPHFYVTVEIDMGAALTLRKQINEGLPDDQKISVNDMVVKAAALALRQFPNLNSHYYGDKLVRYDHINIGIAVPLDNGGLMNVVAKDADITSISRLAQRNKEMIAAARAGRVRPEDVEGSTFTVSNLGPYDVEHFIAIINPPEAGIIAVGTAKEVPVVINGELKVGTRMKCTLSVDHRVSDGVEGAQFMTAFRRLLESPMRLLI